MAGTRHHRLGLAVLAFACGLFGTPARLNGQEPPIEDFSPGFLGMYRKVMEIEPHIQRFARQYDVDVDLARAVCMYESGGNPALSSHAGAQGFFQVMPETYRELRVSTNIEAGVKYLGQMIRQFGREDRAVAAYNAGPGRIGRVGTLPLETVQDVVGVGYYRSVIKQFDETLRRHASRLNLVSVEAGETWSSISSRTGIAEWELRIHNPFLAGRQLRSGWLVAFFPHSRRDLLMPLENGAMYRMRHGDNYISLAIALGIDVEALRTQNGLWQVQAVPPGTLLRIPFEIDRARIVKMALDGPSAEKRGNKATIHHVNRGETLTGIAKRYATTVAALRRTNKLPGTTIRVGQRLIIAAAGNQALD